MKINTLLTALSDLTYTPITHLKIENGNHETDFSHPDISFLSDIVKVFSLFSYNQQDASKINVLENILLFGYVKISESEYLVIGPIIDKHIDNYTAHKLFDSLNLPVNKIKELANYYDQTPHYSIYKLAKIVKFVTNLLNDSNIDVHDVLPKEYTELTTNTEKTSKSEKVASSSIKMEEYEKELYSYIYTGQTTKLKTFLSKQSYGDDVGNLSYSAVQQNKYLIVSSIVLASRAAVRGGVSYNASMELADSYFLKIDKSNVVSELFEIHRNMLFDFSNLVAERKIGKPSSAFFSKIHNYIESHLNEKITTGEIANYLGLNRTYLSAHFKNELGKNLVDYINELKVEEAKRLLIVEDMNAIRVSLELDFSSQSYFQKIFKKYTGTTPKKYKNKNVLL